MRARFFRILIDSTANVPRSGLDPHFFFKETNRVIRSFPSPTTPTSVTIIFASNACLYFLRDTLSTRWPYYIHARIKFFIVYSSTYDPIGRCGLHLPFHRAPLKALLINASPPTCFSLSPLPFICITFSADAIHLFYMLRPNTPSISTHFFFSFGTVTSILWALSLSFAFPFYSLGTHVSTSQNRITSNEQT